DEQQNLEEITEQLNNVEDIKNTLEQLLQMAEAEEVGVADMLRNMNVQLKRLATFGKDYQSLNERLKSLQIELEDILMDLNERHSNLNFSEDEIEQYNNRLQLLYNLQKKHGVKTVADLLDEQKKLQIKVLHVENADEIIGLKENEIADVEKHLNSIADSIRKNRKNAIPLLKKQLEQQLATLEMPNTSLKISIEKSNAFLSNGKDQLSFLIATNKGAAYKPLKKVASGGEMSRIMLAVKAILSNYTNLPTIIFDEIDTGVSGEVATKIAAVMAEMSKNLQVIAITHLPQIAAKGSYHFKVYKKDSGKTTSTEVKLLTKSERINELAEMLSGKEVVASAVKHAKQLLTQ
ncbi:MAG: DNA repair protein RecN, partial [Flavobacteriales bacterium]